MAQLDTQVVWESVDPTNGTVVPYDKKITEELEKTFRYRLLNSAEDPLVRFEFRNRRFIVDVSEKLQRSTEGGGRRRVVRRLGCMPSPRLTCRLELTLLETERYFPFVGWGKQRLPTDRHQWADQTGKHTATQAEVEGLVKGEGHSWSLTPDHWTLWKEDGKTDADGWQYALDFSATFENHKTVKDVVRRRFWTRSATLNGPTESRLNILPQLLPFVSSVSYSPFRPDVAHLEVLEKDFWALWHLTQTLHLTTREVLLRERAADLEAILRQRLASWEVCDRNDIAHELQRREKQLLSQKSMALDKWSSLRGPRQAALTLRVTNGINLELPMRFMTPSHQLQCVVNFLADNIVVRSNFVPLSQNPQFDFEVFHVLSDDTKPIVISIEAVAQGFVELLDSSVGVCMIALDLRAALPSLKRYVTETLVYSERGEAIFDCLSADATRNVSSKLRVKWSLEPRESDFLEYCDDCGNNVSKCSCAPEVVDARQKQRCEAEAKRQAEIYAERQKRTLAAEKVQAEKSAQLMEKLRVEQVRAQRAVLEEESSARRQITVDGEAGAEVVEHRGLELRRMYEHQRRRQDILRRFFKTLVQQLHNDKHAFRLGYFGKWQMWVEDRALVRKELGRLAAEVKKLETIESTGRDAIKDAADDERAHLVELEAARRPKPQPMSLIPSSSSNERVAEVAVSPALQNLAAEHKSKNDGGAKCCTVM